VVAVRLYQLHRKIGQPIFEKQCRQCNHHRTKSKPVGELRLIFAPRSMKTCAPFVSE
jgi:hypothetical protein